MRSITKALRRAWSALLDLISEPAPGYEPYKLRSLWIARAWRVMREMG